MKYFHSSLGVVLTVGLFLVVEAIISYTAPSACPERRTQEHEGFAEKAWYVDYGEAQAIPAFARKFNVTCNTCHSAYPYLNSVGRKFKQSGYRMPDEDETVDPEMQNHRTISKNLILDEVFPLALGVEGTPFSIETGKTGVFRPLEKLTLIGAGNFGSMASYYATISVEAGEEEFSDFSVGGHAVFGFHPLQYINVVAGHGGIYHHDPYNSRGAHTLVASHAHKSQSQFLQLYGYKGGLFYSAGLNSGPGGRLGQDAEGYGRVAYEVLEKFAFGAYGSFGYTGVERESPFAHDDGGHGHGSEEAGAQQLPRLENATAGIDINAAFGDFNALARFEWWRQVDSAAGSTPATAGNLDGFLELFYVVTLADRPIVLPLVRMDYAQDLDLNRRKLSLTGNVSSYVIANARAGIEITQDVVVPRSSELVTKGSIFFSAYW